MENQIEIWKDIPGYKGHYQVSDLGNVKSLKFGIERILKKTKLENLLAPGEAYTQCTLCDYCGPVVFDSSKGVATCNKCEGTFALSH